MEVSKLCVVFSFILIVLGDKTEKHENLDEQNENFMIDTRFKRESEISNCLRNNRLMVQKKIPAGVLPKPVNRPIGSTIHTLNPLQPRLVPNNLARQIIPLQANNKKVTPVINETKCEENDIKIRDNEHDIPIIDHNDSNHTVNTINDVHPIEKIAEVESSNQVKDEIHDNGKKDESKQEETTPIVNKLPKDENEYKPTQFTEEESESITVGHEDSDINSPSPTFKPNEDTSLHLNNKPEPVLHSTAKQTMPPENISRNLVTKLEHKGLPNVNSSINNKDFIDTINKVISNIKPAQPVTPIKTVGTNTIPAVITPSKALPVPTVDPALRSLNTLKNEEVNPAIQTTPVVDSIDSMPQENNDQVITNVENEPQIVPLLLKPINVGSNDEVVIENNNYEELYETTRGPEKAFPKRITSELRPSRPWSSYYQPSSNYQNNNRYSNGYNHPYSYNIRKYPNQYIVNTYEGLNSNNNINQWNPGYNSYYQSQSPIYGHWTNYRQGYATDRYWRAWRNRQIYIRPKQNGINSACSYKSNGYNIANAPVHNTAPEVIEANAYANQNTSPYSYGNPFRLNSRYGH